MRDCYVFRVRCERHDQAMQVWRRFGGLFPAKDATEVEIPGGVPAHEWDAFVIWIAGFHGQREADGFIPVGTRLDSRNRVSALVGIYVAASRWHSGQHARGYRLLSKAGLRLRDQGLNQPLNQQPAIRALLQDPAARGAARRAYRILFRNRDLL